MWKNKTCRFVGKRNNVEITCDSTDMQYAWKKYRCKKITRGKLTKKFTQIKSHAACVKMGKITMCENHVENERIMCGEGKSHVKMDALHVEI